VMLWRLSLSVVVICRLSSSVTLHGGPVSFRPVRATPCFTGISFSLVVHFVNFLFRLAW